jgi:hypothetical protein
MQVMICKAVDPLSESVNFTINKYNAPDKFPNIKLIWRKHSWYHGYSCNMYSELVMGYNF